MLKRLTPGNKRMIPSPTIFMLNPSDISARLPYFMPAPRCKFRGKGTEKSPAKVRKEKKARRKAQKQGRRNARR